MKNILSKRILSSVMAAIMAAIFMCSGTTAFAALSNEKVNNDYRNLQIMNQRNEIINKPIAQFAAKRVKNGEVKDVAVSYTDYDCTTDFPTLVCYVGDTLTFEDLSRDTNQGGSIVLWDWQRFGAMGTKYEIRDYNVVNDTTYQLTEPGETTFYLCVNSNAKVKKGCCAPWSENGNHQTVGRNKWFPHGAYWYFTAVRVVVKPVQEAVVHVRYWDTQFNNILHEETVSAGVLLNDTDMIDTTISIPDWGGYEYEGWNVQLLDGTVQYSGFEREVKITLAGWVPEKNLNIEYVPRMETGVEVRYWDSAENTILHSDFLPGEPVIKEQETQITVFMQPPEWYKMTGWNVQLPDGKIQYTGTENPTAVTLNGYVPNKYLNVECKPISNTKLTVRYIDTETKEVLNTDVFWGEEVYGDRQTTITTEVKVIDGYVTEGWRVKMPDGNVEHTGTKETVSVTLSEQTPHKILEVDCFRLLPGDEEKEEEPLPEPTVTLKPTGECNGIIEWTETDSHRVFTGDYTPGGKKKYRTCRHSFAYKSVLTATANVTPSTLKSGYGFKTEVNANVATNLVSNNGGCDDWGNHRTPFMTIKNPTTSTVYIPWDMTNRLGTQNKTITMEQDGTLKWILPVSHVSETGARKIYTPVELPGTEETPVTHNFEIYISGGGLERVEFCLKLDESITVNGDMYSDDFSGSD